MAINFSAANAVGLNNPGTEIITLVKDGGGNFINPPSYDKMRAYLSSGEVPMLFVTDEGGETGSLYQLADYSETENKIRFSNDANAIEFGAGYEVPVVSDVVPKPLTYDYMPEGYPKKSVQTTTLMAEQQLAFAHVANGIYGSALTNQLAIVQGQTYMVNWDGTEYECVCVDDGKVAYFGNTSIMGWGEDTGEPFSYLPDDGAFATLDTSASHTISVKRTGETVTPMAEEFLPTGVTAAAIDNAQTAADNAQTAADNAQTAADNAQTAADNAQTAANSNKEVLDCAFSSVATFTFDKQTSGRDTFAFNAYDYYKISGFNPSPSDVISFTGTRESGDELSTITIGNNCVEYGFFIIVASAGVCSLPVTETATRSFTAPSAGLYAKYQVDLPFQTAGTGEFTLREATGSFSITGLLLKSSTANSTKKFKITVDDSGALSATEII